MNYVKNMNKSFNKFYNVVTEDKDIDHLKEIATQWFDDYCHLNVTIADSDRKIREKRASKLSKEMLKIFEKFGIDELRAKRIIEEEVNRFIPSKINFVYGLEKNHKIMSITDREDRLFNDFGRSIAELLMLNMYV